ncbi:transglycosylase family protein [Candidatus Poriferisocius sp.]|uniref:transglycosylase family protein n=1 Tax=Candidatus Poriferisocius sp. TaxID=3101276 RepID=UPI003B58BA21
MAVASISAAVGGVAFGQADGQSEAVEPVAVESANPPWRDLERAQHDLEVAQAARASAQAALDATVEELHRELGRLDQLNAIDAGERLLRQEAESLVVQEYIHGSEIEDLEFILGVTEATDALWREALLLEMADLMDQALSSVEDVSGERERTAARIGRLNDAIPYLNSRLSDTGQSVEAAEWVVYIAEINDLADRELAKNRFIEPTEQQWFNLRWCESTNNYSVESSNGLFYGAYQFEPRTWRTVGGTGNPAHAPPEEQDARARLLYSRRGSQPWPVDYCGRWLPQPWTR